jgi:hypothetical protein
MQNKYPIGGYAPGSRETIEDILLKTGKHNQEECSEIADAILNDLPKAKGAVSNDADEKEIMMQAFENVRQLFEGRQWIMDGRGSYPYNDDRYKEEVRYMYDEFEAIRKDTWANIQSKSVDYRKRIIEQYLQDNPTGYAWVKGAPKNDTSKINQYFAKYKSPIDDCEHPCVLHVWRPSGLDRTIYEVNGNRLHNFVNPENIVEYLHETPSKESDAVEFAEWAAQIAWFDEEYHLWNLFEEGKMIDGQLRFTTKELLKLYQQSKK